MTAQQFVDFLNIKTMPEFGYELVGGYWCWPVYNWSKRSQDDFSGKDHISAQRKRCGTQEYEAELTPANEATRQRAHMKERA